MTRMGDSTEIMGKTLLVGDMQSRVVEADAARAREAREKHSAIAKGGQAERDLRRVAKENRLLNVQLEEAKKALAEKDALIFEWMHSNEAFKRLAKQYSKKLGVSDEQRISDVYDEVKNVAEEDPVFSSTKILGKADAHMKTKI